MIRDIHSRTLKHAFPKLSSFWAMIKTMLKFFWQEIKNIPNNTDSEFDDQDFERRLLIAIIENPNINDDDAGEEIADYIVNFDLSMRLIRTKRMIELAFKLRPDLIIPAISLEDKPETQPE